MNLPRFIVPLAVLLFAVVSQARAGEYIPRGLGHPDGAAHWYESGCCDKRDCEPVEPGAIRQTDKGYMVRYITSRGFIAEGIVPYGSSAIRPLRDEREHGCASPVRVLCIYIHLFG